MNTPVTLEQIAAWSEEYQQNVQRRMATRAFAMCAMQDVMHVQEASNQMRQKFSLELKTLPVTNQKASGRCWLFAATNVLREKIAKDLNMKNFELSQAYLAFWDKFERCNFMLESIIETAAQPADSRDVQFILQTGVHDGGQWDMVVNVINKYGIMPRDVYDDTYQACHTRDTNYYLNRALKKAAAALRKMIAEGADAEAVQAEKNKVLGQCYGFLCSCYGEAPKTFTFEYVDKDGNYHNEGEFNAMTFAEKYVGDCLSATVSIINAPTADKPYDKVFTIRMLGNVADGREVRHLNLDMDTFKQAIIAQMQAGKVVWFGSDVGHFGTRDAGIWDNNCFDAELFTGLDLDISKEDGLNYCFSAMNHAMVITGVNLVDGKPTRWKIENSWGDEHGEKGYYICSDSWFDQYVYQAAVEKEYLGEKAALCDQKAIVLQPWDPMGTLA